MVLLLGYVLDWHLLGDPAERNTGLRAAQLLQRDLGDVGLTGHADSGSQHPMRADEIGVLPDALARRPHRLVVIAADELGVGGDAAINRGWRIVRAQAQGALRCGLQPAPAIGHRQTVVFGSRRQPQFCKRDRGHRERISRALR